MEDMSKFLYEGNEPYIFISYSHVDSKTVLPIIEALLWRGFRVWFDLGIPHGSSWDDVVADHLLKSSVILTCLSENYAESRWCCNEIRLGIKREIPMLHLYLQKEEEVHLSSGIEMNMGTNHYMNMLQYPTLARLTENLFQEELFQPCQMESPPDLNAENGADTFDLQKYEKKQFWKSAFDFLKRTTLLHFLGSTVIVGFWGSKLSVLVSELVEKSSAAGLSGIFGSSVVSAYAEYIGIFGAVFSSVILSLAVSAAIVLMKHRGGKLYKNKWEERYHYRWYCGAVADLFASIGMVFYPYVLAASPLLLPLLILLLILNPLDAASSLITRHNRRHT